MKEELKAIIDNLVDDKESVSIEEIEAEREIKFEIKVAKEDMGKVIGREGRLAKAIRIITKSMGANTKKRIIVEFID